MILNTRQNIIAIGNTINKATFAVSDAMATAITNFSGLFF